MNLRRFDPTANRVTRDGDPPFDWQSLGLTGVEGVDWRVVVVAMLGQYGGAIRMNVNTIRKALRDVIEDALVPVIELHQGSDEVVIRVAFGKKALPAGGVVEGAAVDKGVEVQRPAVDKARDLQRLPFASDPDE